MLNTEFFDTPLFCYGRVGKTQGLEGFVTVQSFSGEIKHLCLLSRVQLKKNGKTIVVDIDKVRIHGKALLMQFKNYITPESVKPLIGMELWAEKNVAPPLSENQYYSSDLVGMYLVLDQSRIAQISAVCSSSAGDLLEVCMMDGKTRYVPFRKEFIGLVDLAARTMELLNPMILD